MKEEEAKFIIYGMRGIYKADISLLKRALPSRLIIFCTLYDFEAKSYVSHLTSLNQDTGAKPCFTERLTVSLPGPCQLTGHQGPYLGTHRPDTLVMDQPFIQLNNQRQQGPTPGIHQGSFIPRNHVGPTPPPGPPMGQMPYGHPGTQPGHGSHFQGGQLTQHALGQSDIYGFPPPAPRGLSTPFSRSSHSSRRSPPIIHNTALERRQQPTTEVHDIRTTVNTEADARRALSTFVVCTITKAANENEEDEYGLPPEPTWQRAVHTTETGVTQREAERKIRELQYYTKSVSDKKADLASPIKTQLQYAQEKLEREERDRRYRYELIQLEQVIKRVEVAPYQAGWYYEEDWSDRRRHSRSKDRRSSKDKKKRDKYKYKKGKYVIEPHKSWKSKSKRQTESVTAYYRRSPCDGIDCLQLWQDYDDGFESWDSPNSSPRLLMQQPFGGNRQHSPNQFNGQGTHHQQYHGNQMHMPQPHHPQNFHAHLSNGMNGQQGIPPQHQNGPHVQAGFPPQQQQMPGVQGVPPPHHNQQQGFPQQTQYANNQGQRNYAQQGQQRGPPNHDPRVQQGQHERPQNVQHAQARPGQHGGPHNFPPGGGHGQHPPGNRTPFNGPPNGQMGARQAPNQGAQRPPGQRPGHPPQGGKMHPPPPPPVHHMGAAPRNGSRPPVVLPMSPRSSENSLSGSDYDSGSESGADTAASSISVDSRIGRSPHKSASVRGRSRSQGRGHGPKPWGVPPREHSRVGAPRRRSVTPPTFRPKSAMRDTSRPGLGRHATLQSDIGRSTPRHMATDFDHIPRRARAMSDIDYTTPGMRQHGMSDFNDPRLSRDGLASGVRRVSPASVRHSMFEDDMDIMSDTFDGLRIKRGLSGDRRRFPGPDRLEKGFRDRFGSQQYYYDDDGRKQTRFADGGPGRGYARPMGQTFVNEGRRSLGPRGTGPPRYD